MRRLRKWLAGGAFFIGALVIALALIELVMAIAGMPKGVDFGSDLTFDDVDFRLGLRPGPHEAFGGSFVINSRFTRGPEFDGVDYLAMGDSSTFGVSVPEGKSYSALLGSPSVRSVNGGTPSHNSLDGLWWLKKSGLLRMHPKLVSLYYGWNDHWRAAAPEQAFRWLRHLAPHSRLGTYLLLYEQSIWNDRPPWNRYHWFPQVSLASYKANLKEMIRLSREAGATVVLITAASAPLLAKAGEGRFAHRSIEEFDDHTRYLDATREVARETGAGLVDFAAEIDRRRRESPAEYFIGFGHPNEKGHELLASLLRPWVECAMRSACPPR